MTEFSRNDDHQIAELREAYERAKAAGDQAEMQRLAKKLVDVGMRSVWRKSSTTHPAIRAYLYPDLLIFAGLRRRPIW